jgi:hypothetical protein
MLSSFFGQPIPYSRRERSDAINAEMIDVLLSATEAIGLNVESSA